MIYSTMQIFFENDDFVFKNEEVFKKKGTLKEPLKWQII